MSLTLHSGKLDQFYAAATALSGADRQLELSDILLAPDALDSAVAFALGGRPPGRVLLVQDDTPILRDGQAVKPLVAAMFTASGCEVHTMVVSDPHGVHTTTEHIDAVAAWLEPSDIVVALGSGTIADITKHAVYSFEQANTDTTIRLVVIQTANSVCAYTSGLAVVTSDGVKRTVTSRLPDALLLDTRLLSDAPLPYTLGGIGDASVAAASFADYRLVALLGIGRWEPLSWSLMLPSRTRFLECDPRLADRGDEGAGTLAMDLAACGLAMTFAGESAPLSGLEHVTSHMLDMAADQYGRPVGNHGSQCALATVLTLIAYDKLLQLDRLDLDPDRINPEVARRLVQETFGGIDSSGRAWQECWADYSEKLATWKKHRQAILAFKENWATHRADLAQYVASPAEFIAALAAGGHPLRFADIPTGLDDAQARWAFTGALLMRKRTSVADLLAFAGLWNDQFVDDVFTTYYSLIQSYEPVTAHSIHNPSTTAAKELQ